MSYKHNNGHTEIYNRSYGCEQPYDSYIIPIPKQTFKLYVHILRNPHQALLSI